MSNFDLGYLLKDKVLFGPLSLTAEATGHGLDLKTIKATIKADATSLYLNKYNYHNLKMDGTVSGKQFEGNIKGNDENLAFNFDGLLNLNPNQERCKFLLNVKGADLQKLSFIKEDVQASFAASGDFTAGKSNELNGKAGITNLVIAHKGKKYLLDSFLTVSLNKQNKSEMNANSAIIDIQYTGTVSPVALPAQLSQFINRYFPFSDSNQQFTKSDPFKFSVDILLHNHPIFSEVFFPQLKGFEPGIIRGSFDSRANELKLNATMKRIVL